MLRFIIKNCYLMRLKKQVLVMDIPDHMIYPHLVQKSVKNYLGIQNLQPFEGTEQDVKKIRKYQGAIVGIKSYHFFAIPTALHKPSYTPRYHYFYYLLNTASPISSITLEAFNCLKGNEQFPFADYIEGFLCRVAGKTMVIEQSDRVLPGVNVLGLDFLMSSDEYRLQSQSMKYSMTLELISWQISFINTQFSPDCLFYY